MCSSGRLAGLIGCNLGKLSAGAGEGGMAPPWFNLAGGTSMMLLMLFLTPRIGIRGIAIARLSYAVIPLFLYIPLLRRLSRKSSSGDTLLQSQRVCEAIEGTS